ncbi:predicted protein [Botrytis cinerea T4]|uniref:Uncharacterized protein n=1 Tax=Botryotinia fuckeliana (strain T4) TaxID=999810 RepID=G2YUF6_BOTF4|nr:predicted protein [Botrytis cinerea T4]
MSSQIKTGDYSDHHRYVTCEAVLRLLIISIQPPRIELGNST